MNLLYMAIQLFQYHYKKFIFSLTELLGIFAKNKLTNEGKLRKSVIADILWKDGYRKFLKQTGNFKKDSWNMRREKEERKKVKIWVNKVSFLYGYANQLNMQLGL